MTPPLSRHTVLSAALAILTATQAAGTTGDQAGELEDFDRLKQTTAMVTVYRQEQAAARGAGVVLCQEGRRAYVLTARHLLAGGAPADRAAALPSGRTEIAFFGDLPPVVAEPTGGGQDVTVHELPELDLALLVLRQSKKLENTAYLGPPVAMLGNGGGRPRVMAVGYRASSAEPWALEPGELAPVDGPLLRHSATFADGFAGGPLFSAEGAWIGVNRPASAGDSETAGGEAISAESLLPAIDPWLPEACLRASIRREKMIIPGIIHRRDEVPEMLLHHAEPMEVKISPLRINPKLDFGPYHVTSKRKAKLSIAEAGGSTWQAQCKKEKIGSLLGRMAFRALDRAVDRTIGLGTPQQGSNKPYKLTCAFGEDGGPGIGRMTMKVGTGTIAGGGSGAIRVDGEQVDVVSSGDDEVTYLFYAGDHLLGGVWTGDFHSNVWLLPQVSGEARAAVVLASSALLWRYAKEP